MLRKQKHVSNTETSSAESVHCNITKEISTQTEPDVASIDEEYVHEEFVQLPIEEYHEVIQKEFVQLPIEEPQEVPDNEFVEVPFKDSDPLTTFLHPLTPTVTELTYDSDFMSLNLLEI